MESTLETEFLDENETLPLASVESTPIEEFIRSYFRENLYLLLKNELEAEIEEMKEHNTFYGPSLKNWLSPIDIS